MHTHIHTSCTSCKVPFTQIVLVLHRHKLLLHSILPPQTYCLETAVFVLFFFFYYLSWLYGLTTPSREVLLYITSAGAAASWSIHWAALPQIFTWPAVGTVSRLVADLGSLSECLGSPSCQPLHGAWAPHSTVPGTQEITRETSLSTEVLMII